MDARAKTVSEILHAGDQYLIPFFQRTYSWTHKHWQRLRDDIWALVDDGATGQHFLGPLVCTPAEHIPAEVTPYQLIDGQQRLTTLTLLLSALRDVAKEHNLGELAEEVTENYLIHKYRKGTQRYKVVPRAEDRDALIAVVEGHVEKEHERFDVCRAWRFFQKNIRELAATGPEEQLGKLLAAVVSRLSLVVVTIAGENPYEIFESLNSTGLTLAESDLVRNYIFMQVPQPEQDAFQAQHWQSFEAMFEAADNCEELPATLFYRNYLMRNGTYSKARSTFVDFKAENKRRGMRPADQVSELDRFARCELLLRRPSTCQDAELRWALSQVAMLEITTAHPLLLNLMDRQEQGQLPKEELLGCIDDLASFVVRRSICGESTRTYGLWFTEAIKAISSAPREDLKKYWLKRGWPDDKAFVARLMDFALYRRDPKKCRLILETLEQSYKHKEKVDPATLTIEHVMPQTMKNGSAADGWRKMLGTNWKDVHERLLHTLGNLTLSGYNPDMGNHTFAEKNREYSKSNLVLNRYFSDVRAWDEDAILERGRKLASEVVQLWPRNSDEPYVPIQAYTTTGLSREKRLQYWKDFLNADEWDGLSKLPKPSYRRWVRFLTGCSGVPLLAFIGGAKQEIGVAFKCRGKRGKALFGHLLRKKERLEAVTGHLDWKDHAKGPSYIMLTLAADAANEAAWAEQHAWLWQHVKAFKNGFSQVMAELVSEKAISGPTPTAFSKVASEIIAKRLGGEILRQSAGHVKFLPSSWISIVPENGTAWGDLARPVSVCCWFDKRPSKARLVFEVSSMDDPQLRLKCVEALQAAGFKLTRLAFNQDARLSRFYRSSADVADWTNEEEIAGVLAMLFSKAQPKLSAAEQVLKKVFPANQTGKAQA